MSMLQDAHIHLQSAGDEAEKIASLADGQGVGRFFCNGVSPSDWGRVRSLADSFKCVVPFFGVHPWYVDDAPQGWETELERYLESPNSRMGEIGLDGAKKDVDFSRQREIFAAQLDIAVRMKKSFTVHCVNAWDAFLEEIASRGSDVSFMIHWFSGSAEVAEQLVARGAYISFSPRLLYERAKKHRAVFDAMPIDRILLETDYPYLPGMKEGEVVEASKYFEWLSALYGIAARLKNMDERELIDKVWDNGTIFLH